MAKKNTTAAAAAAAAAKETETETKRARKAVTLVGNGPGNTLTITATELLDGRFRVQAIHRVGEARITGMRSYHDSFFAATAAQDELILMATTKGWEKKLPKGRPAKPSFSEIPDMAPEPVAKPAKPAKPTARDLLVRRTAKPIKPRANA